MRILITGMSGFVSPHFLDYLNIIEPGSIVLGIARNLDNFDCIRYSNLEITLKQINLGDKGVVGSILDNFKPQYILHLASVSSVALSWQTPVESFINNTNIFLNLVEGIRVAGIKCRILSIGSSEEYGEPKENELPLTENHPLKPLSPYAAARISQEMLSKLYADGYKLDIIITRSFNHIGPGQKSLFVVSSFARQLVMLKKSAAIEKKITTGDLNVIRDFLDVRDVVKAYYLLLKYGKTGEVYNVCSGKGISLYDVLLKMCRILNLDVNISVNPSLIRPNEVKVIFGSHEKITKELNWQPTIYLEQSLSDVIEYWQRTENDIG